MRELKRQIATLYYERTGLSRNKKKLASLVEQTSEKQEARLPIRDPYIFEFLGLKSKEVMGESEIEDALERGAGMSNALSKSKYGWKNICKLWLQERTPEQFKGAGNY